MVDPVNVREYGWTQSSDSDVSAELFAKEVESEYRSNEEDEVPFARHGPIVEANLEELANQREFWNSYAIGFILDYRKFSVSHLQHILNATWRLQESMTIVGKDSYFYLLHFNSTEDLNNICNNSPWAINGSLFVLKKWWSNFVFLWVQLHGLPLEYQYPEMAERMGHIMGIVEQVD